MIDGFDLVKSDRDSNLRTAINETVFTTYGIVKEVLDNEKVIAELAYRRGSAVSRFSCKYLGFSNKNFEIDCKPTVGDKVLIIALQHRDDDIFTATESLEVSKITGYTVYSCIAIPLGTVKGESDTSVVFSKESVAVESTLDLRVKAKTINLNGDSESFALHSHLDTALQAFKTLVNTELGKIATGIGSAGGTYTPASTTIDISAAKSTTVLTGD